jgi:hypothetical protein
MADRRGILIPLIILCWIILAPNANRAPISPYEGRRIDDAIADEQASLAILRNSTWNDTLNLEQSSLNLTGLEPDRGYAWSTLSNVQKRVQEHLKYALGEWGVQTLGALPGKPNAIPLYANITGHVRGKWQRSTLQQDLVIPNLNFSHYTIPTPFGQSSPLATFQRNITGQAGEIALRLNDAQTSTPELQGRKPGTLAEISVQMEITDTKSHEQWDMKLYGVHFVDLGQAILTTTSDKFAGIFMLPQFTLSERTFEGAQAILNRTIPRVIERQISGKLDALKPWAASIEATHESFSQPACDLIVYLQQLTPVTNKHLSSSLVSFLEHELRFPTGAFLPKAPDLRFSMVAFSPDCGFILESNGPPDVARMDGNHLIGPKMEVEYHHGRQHLLIFTITLALQLWLLMRQMHEANTPSTRSRISFYSIAMLALGDGFTTLTFLLLSMFIPGLWINLVATSFLAFSNVFLFDMRFLMDLWAVQAPERARRAREQADAARRRREENERSSQQTSSNSSPPTDLRNQGATPAPSTDLPATDTLPLPVTASRPSRLIDTGALPIFVPSDQDINNAEAAEPNAVDPTAAGNGEARTPSFGSLYTRFYLFLLAVLFLSLNASAWPAPASRTYFTFQSLAYLSFWIPQIYRNIHRNCRVPALTWEFVVGQSILRLVPFVYFFGYGGNVLFADPNWLSLALMFLWVWVQVVLLVSQNLFGPRWFWLGSAPPAFDYHPLLREDEEGAMMPIGFSQAAAAGAAGVSSVPSTPSLERRPSSFSIPKDTKGTGKRIFDCAICMQDLEVPIVEAGGGTGDASLGGSAGLLARRMYMVTPCRHIFHSACLEGWMKYRLQCPICRETLPPL